MADPRAGSQPDQETGPGVVTPGTLLRAARLEQGLETAEVARALNWLPSYVAVIEEDRHEDLRSPSFGRGYVKAYARQVGIGQPRILRALDEWEEDLAQSGKRPGGRGAGSSRRPPQLQKSGVGVFTGLAVLALLAAGLWWWQGGANESAVQPAASNSQPAASAVGGGAE